MVNDMTIIYGFVTFFVLIGIVTPYINAEFNSSYPVNDAETLIDIDTDKAVSSVSAFKVIGSVITMFFWSFGNLPVWLDLVLFLPLRVVFYLIIARNIWIGGGN